MENIQPTLTQMELPILKNQQWSAPVVRMHVMKKERLVGMWIGQCVDWDHPKIYEGQSLIIQSSKGEKMIIKVDMISYVRKSLVYPNTRVMDSYTDGQSTGSEQVDPWMVSIMFKEHNKSVLVQWEQLKTQLYATEPIHLWCRNESVKVLQKALV